jgi:hypothetical protein
MSSNYYVTIDSNYRDRESFPLESDFGVSFETKNSSLQYPQGQPLDSTQFFPRMTIDKNFKSLNVKVSNGVITDVIHDKNTNETLYAGYQITNGESNNFMIYFNDQIIYSQFQTVSIYPIPDFITNYQAYKDTLQLPFLFKLSSSNELVWFIIGALADVDKQTYAGLNKTYYVQANINDSGNYFLSFDYQLNLSFYQTTIQNNTENTISLGYDIINPYGNGMTAFSIVGFSSDGMKLFTNNVPWGYHNFYTTANYSGTSSPFNIITSTDYGWNKVLTDKGDNFFIGTEVNNIVPSFTNINLDNISGTCTNTPIYYPLQISQTINPWETLTTSFDIVDLSSNPTYKNKSISLLLCNYNNGSHQGISILASTLQEKKLPVRNNGIEDFSASQVYERKFDFLNGTFNSMSTGPVFLPSIDQCYTSSFYRSTGTSGYIICDNTPFLSNVATLNTISFNIDNTSTPFTIDLVEEANITLDDTFCKIYSISTVQISATNFYVFVLWTNDALYIDTTITLFNYNSSLNTFSTVSTMNIDNMFYGGIYYDVTNSLYICWITSNQVTGNIYFYNTSFTQIGLLLSNDIGEGIRSGFKAYVLSSPTFTAQGYFSLCIKGMTKTFKINVVNPTTITFTSQTDILNQASSIYPWINKNTNKQYLVSSNPYLGSYNIFNNITGLEVGQNSQIGSFNSIHYVSNGPTTYGDIYAVTKEPNTLNASWGSLLQDPIFVSSHVYQNPNTYLYLSKTITTSSTFQANGELYAVYAYTTAGATTTPVYLYVYNITDINNIKFIGTISSDSTVLPLFTISTTFFNNTVFILCQSYNPISYVTKVIKFSLSDITSYIVETIQTPIRPFDRYTLSNFITNNDLYIYQTYQNSSIGSGFYVAKYLYNPTSNTFSNSPSTSYFNYPNINNNGLYGLTSIFYYIENIYQIIVIARDNTTNFHTLYFINFSDLSLAYIESTQLEALSSPDYFTVTSTLNFYDKTNLLFFNYYSTSDTKAFVTTYYVPSLSTDLSYYLAKLNSNIFIPYTYKKGQFSSFYNTATERVFLVCEDVTTFCIYSIFNYLANQLAFIDKLLLTNNPLEEYSDVDSLITSSFSTTGYLIVTANTNGFLGNPTKYISKIIQITIPQFAQDYSLPTRVETTSTVYGKGISTITKLNSIGQTNWINSIGDIFPSSNDASLIDSQYVNTIGFCLSASELTMCCSYMWKSKIAIVNYNDSFDTNRLTNPFNLNETTNSCLLNIRTDNGKAQYILPICGTLNTAATNPTTVSGLFSVGINYFSSILYIYGTQSSRSTGTTALSNPIIIQKTLPSITYQNGAVITINELGTLQWTSYLQSSIPNVYSYIYLINSVNNILTVVGTTYQGNIDIFDNSNNIVQTIYPFTETTLTEYVMSIRYNSDGTYLESSSFETPNSIAPTTNNPKIEPWATISIPSNNEILYSNTLVTVQDSILRYKNKDGTLAKVDTFSGQNIYSQKYYYTGPGVYDFTIPTGCIGVKVKLWGSGGSANQLSLANGWKSFGGGGGYAERQITYPEGTPFKIKVGEAGNGGQSSLTGSLTSIGGAGGESSYFHSYIDGVWNVEAVAAGGGGAASGNLVLGYGDGGSAGYIGKEGFGTPFTNPGQQGFNGGGGLGGDFAGNISSQNGINFIDNTVIYSSTLGKGGNASVDSLTAFTQGGGAGGDGYGGGGAGDPGIGSIPYNNKYACGGGGGGSYGSRVVLRYPTEPVFYPANFSDIDFYPLIASGFYNQEFLYGAGGWPIANPVSGNYNYKGTNGVAVVYFYYQSSTGLNTPAFLNQSAVVKYKYTSDYTDANLKNYSILTVYKSNDNIDDTFVPYESLSSTGSLTNYYTYILGTGTNNPLNQNFLIRTNYFNPDDNSYNIVLNQKIDTTKLTRLFNEVNNDPNTIYFYSSNISKTPINSIISYTGTINPNIIKINYTSSPISLNSTYYVLGQSLTGTINTIIVTNINSTGGYIYLTLNTLANLQGYGPYLYLVKFNNTSLYNLQFNPTNIYKPTYYNISLQRLTIPNRPIRSGTIPGVRYLSDFPYIFLQLYNTDNNGNIDQESINSIYTNNPNGPPLGGYNSNTLSYPNNSIYTIDIPSAGGESNFLFLSSGFVPRIKFTPGFYNIRVRLIDPEGNVIIFDNTPVKSNDSVFGTGVVDSSLMRVVAQLAFKIV